MLTLSINQAGMQEQIRAAIASKVLDLQTAAVEILKTVGAETVAYLRSVTDEMRPPIGAHLNATAAVEGGYYALEEGGFVRAQGPKRAIAARMTLGSGVPRPAHPGHWADITGHLALSYAFSVVPTWNGARLTLSNSAEYAVYLERRNGFYVLSGVTDPGGPVETQLRAAVAVIDPTWEVRRVA